MYKYTPYDKMAVERIKKQREASFRQGLTNEKLPVTIVEARKQHEENIKALTTTLAVFADFSPSRNTIKRIKERLEQEEKWAKHYAACAEEHKKGSERLTNLLKGQDFKIVVDVTVTEESERRKAPKVKTRKEELQERFADRVAAQPMVAKAPVAAAIPEEAKGLRGRARRDFFMGRRPN